MSADYPKLKYKLKIKKFGLQLKLPGEPMVTDTQGVIEGLGTPGVILHDVAVYGDDFRSATYNLSVFFQSSDDGDAQAAAIIAAENLEHLFPDGEFQRVELNDELTQLQTDEFELRKYTKDHSTKYTFSYANGLFVYVLSVTERDVDDSTNFVNYIRTFKPSMPKF